MNGVVLRGKQLLRREISRTEVYVADVILVGKKEAARLLSVSPRTIDNLVRFKEICPRRIGRRVLFERAELERFARRDHQTQPDGDTHGVR